MQGSLISAIWQALRSNPDLLDAYSAGCQIETVVQDGKLTADYLRVDREIRSRWDVQ